jgi:hypothetical protein
MWVDDRFDRVKRFLVALALAAAILVAPEWLGCYVANGCQYLPTVVVTPRGDQVVRECWPSEYKRPRLVTYAEAHGPDSSYPVCYDCGAQPATLPLIGLHRREPFVEPLAHRQGRLRDRGDDVLFGCQPLPRFLLGAAHLRLAVSRPVAIDGSPVGRPSDDAIPAALGPLRLVKDGAAPEAERPPHLLDAGVERLDRAVVAARVPRPLPLLGLVVDGVLFGCHHAPRPTEINSRRRLNPSSRVARAWLALRAELYSVGLRPIVVR